MGSQNSKYDEIHKSLGWGCSMRCQSLIRINRMPMLGPVSAQEGKEGFCTREQLSQEGIQIGDWAGMYSQGLSGVEKEIHRVGWHGKSEAKQCEESIHAWVDTTLCGQWETRVKRLSVHGEF